MICPLWAMIRLFPSSGAGAKASSFTTLSAPAISFLVVIPRCFVPDGRMAGCETSFGSFRVVWLIQDLCVSLVCWGVWSGHRASLECPQMCPIICDRTAIINPRVSSCAPALPASPSARCRSRPSPPETGRLPAPSNERIRHEYMYTPATGGNRWTSIWHQIPQSRHCAHVVS